MGGARYPEGRSLCSAVGWTLSEPSCGSARVEAAWAGRAGSRRAACPSWFQTGPEIVPEGQKNRFHQLVLVLVLTRSASGLRTHPLSAANPGRQAPLQRRDGGVPQQLHVGPLQDVLRDIIVLQKDVGGRRVSGPGQNHHVAASAHRLDRNTGQRRRLGEERPDRKQNSPPGRGTSGSEDTGWV